MIIKTHKNKSQKTNSLISDYSFIRTLNKETFKIKINLKKTLVKKSNIIFFFEYECYYIAVEHFFFLLLELIRPAYETPRFRICMFIQW